MPLFCHIPANYPDIVAPACPYYPIILNAILPRPFFQFLRGIWERGKHCNEPKLKSLRQESSIYGLLIILCKQTSKHSVCGHTTSVQYN